MVQHDNDHESSTAEVASSKRAAGHWTSSGLRVEEGAGLEQVVGYRLVCDTWPDTLERLCRDEVEAFHHTGHLSELRPIEREAPHVLDPRWQEM